MRKNKQKSVLAFPVIAVVSLVSLFSGCGRQQAEIDHKKEIVRHVVENVFNNGKLDAISTHYSTSYIRHMCESPDIRGLDAFAGYLQNCIPLIRMYV